MSILDTLKNFEHTATHWIATEWQKVFSAIPKVETVADTFFKYAIPGTGIILDAIGQGELAAPATAILTEAQKDLHAVSALVYDFGATPQAKGILTAVANNLGTLATDAHIVSINATDKVNKIVAGANALAALMPNPAPAA